MEYVPDYNDLHAEHEREQEKKLNRLPKCRCCGEPITDETFHNIHGMFICKECLAGYRVYTDDYIQE